MDKLHAKGQRWVPIVDPGIMVNPEVRYCSSAVSSQHGIQTQEWRCCHASMYVVHDGMSERQDAWPTQDAAYTDGLARDVFLKDVTGQPYVGQVTPRS